MTIDKHHTFDEVIFTYQALKDGRILIFWHGKQVKILKGRAAQQFLVSIINRDQQDAQLLMAKATGNFKRGNERSSDQPPQALT